MADSPVALPKDKAARNLLRVFATVVVGLLSFYSFVVYRALVWTPAFYVANADSERSRIQLEYPEEPIVEERDLGPSIVARGERVYLENGCAVCHGIGAQGGVESPNYLKGTIPPLVATETCMCITSDDQTQMLVTALSSGKDLGEVPYLQETIGPIILAQYDAMVDIILTGRPAKKLDPEGIEPLAMPGWRGKLTTPEVNSLIAYLLSLSQQKAGEAVALAGETEQPIAFNHSIHFQENEITCADCHKQQDDSHGAIPNTKTCARCHTPKDWTDEPSLDHPGAHLAKYLETGEPIPWERIFELGEHIVFPHERHTSSGTILCEQCHGDFGAQEAPPSRPLKELSISHCVGCHLDKQVNGKCVVCHD